MYLTAVVAGLPSGLQGYLRCTVVVLGPGDKAVVHTAEQDEQDDEANGEEESKADDGSSNKK